MKIVCDACQAKYSISDDKVQGKVFKIRCKKCSNIIVVRGGGGAEAAAAPEPQQAKETRVYDYGYEGGDQAPAGDEAVWHVVINQDQVGPMTAADLQHRFSAGEIDAETYIWREGFADWLPIAQVDTFAAFVAAAASGAHGGNGGGRDAVQSMFAGGGTDDTGTMRQADPGDLFAAASAPRAQEHDDDGGDLFGQQQPRTKAPTGSPDAAKLRGERNENSVLFSLGNLAQLASNQPQQSVSSTPSGHATGQAGGEGSGLIDIRSMANAYLGGGAGPAKAATASVGTIDDLPVFSGGGFAEPAVFVPTARPANNNKILYAMIGAVGLLAIVAVVLVLVIVKSGGKTTEPTAVAAVGTGSQAEPAAIPATGSAAAPSENTATPPSGSSAPQVANNDKPPPADTTPPPAQPAHETTAAKKTPAPVHETPAAKKTPAHEAHESHAAMAAPSAKEPPAPKAEKTAAAPAGGGDCDEVSCLLNNNDGPCCAKFKKGKKAAPSGGGGDSPSAPKSDLPDTLDRDMISGGVAKVKARVMACGDKSSAKGTVKVHVKVTGAGTVSDVSVSSSPDDALGSCVKAAMSRASFPKTQSGGSFGYPFVF
jgi:predicted Zn finger-like uncharacterized protein